MKQLKPFLLPYGLIAMMAFAIFLRYGHGSSVLWINGHHTPYLDFAFTYITYLGDGIAVFLVVVILLFSRRKYGYVLALIGVALAIVSYVLKHWVFGRVPRPKRFFDSEVPLNFVEGVEIHGFYSFPSGHTMTAFSLAMFLSLAMNKRIYSWIFLFLACMAGFSRIYLLQHFLIDVIVGSMIGVILSVSFYWSFRNYLHPPTVPA